MPRGSCGWRPAIEVGRRAVVEVLEYEVTPGAILPVITVHASTRGFCGERSCGVGVRLGGKGGAHQLPRLGSFQLYVARGT